MNKSRTAQKTKNSNLVPLNYIRPTNGGVAEYSKRIEQIYGAQGYSLSILEVDEDTDLELMYLRLKASGGLCHLEIGASDSRIFALSKLLLAAEVKHIVTLHDPGVLVRHPLDFALCLDERKYVRFAAKVYRKVANVIVGKVVLKRYLASKNLVMIFLRPDLVTIERSYYLPQPLYHKVAPLVRKQTKQLRLVGFGGYWGYGKGVETLLDAFTRPELEDIDLVVAGAASSTSDPYAIALLKQIHTITPSAQTPGFIPNEDLDSFLRGLDVLCLPYWPGLPNGTSAMAMRAGELGVPVVASDLPSIKGELGNKGAVYVPPKDPAALTRAILGMADNWEKTQLHVMEVQERLVLSHGWSRVGVQLKRIIQNEFKDVAA